MGITLRTWLQKFSRLFDSPKMFWIVFGWFMFSALWIGLSGAYSMAFDEYVHYGITKLYEQQWSPFFASQPISADAFGAITRDGSYFYHYLMSFPLRLISVFHPSLTIEIIFLRVWSIAFFAGGILLFRAAFKRAGLTNRMVNLVLGFFMLMPVAPLAASQVNYDTLLFLLTGVTVWLAVRCSLILRQTKQIPVSLLSWLITTMAFASIVKYAFLPIAVGVTIYFVIIIWQSVGLKRTTWTTAIKHEFTTAKWWRLVATAFLLLLSLGLFAERYGINTLKYHTPTPECNQVMALQRCFAYEPFERNYNYHQGNYPLPAHKIAAYPFNNWIRGMIRSLFHVVSSKTAYGYFAGEPFLLPHILGFIVFAGGLVAVLVHGKWLWLRNHTNQLFIVLSAIYAGLLFAQNFMDFLHTHVAVAIQGRYLLPIIPMFLVLVVQAYGRLLHNVSTNIKTAALVLACIMILQGGSLLPFIIRHSDDWVWNTPLAQQTNKAAQNALKPLVISKKIWIFD